MSRIVRTGFSLVELVLAIAIVAVLALVAVPGYSQYVERTRVNQAVFDIMALNALIKGYYQDNRDYPDSLSQVGAGTKVDPWGQPYVYHVFRTPADMGTARKDKNLVPINSDYDLYSIGKDHASRPPLLAAQSRDDVVRANDGSFVGLASSYTQ
jgi:general secretion pathway protein G